MGILAIAFGIIVYWLNAKRLRRVWNGDEAELDRTFKGWKVIWPWSDSALWRFIRVWPVFTVGALLLAVGSFAIVVAPEATRRGADGLRVALDLTLSIVGFSYLGLLVMGLSLWIGGWPKVLVPPGVRRRCGGKGRR